MVISSSHIQRVPVRLVLLLAGLCFANLAMPQVQVKPSDDPAALAIVLSVKKVVVSGQGKETLSDAPETRPGDMLEYSAVYTNRSGKAVKDIVATLPIPQNTAYEPNTAKPRGAQASTGADYAAEPLLRKVRTTDGQEKSEPVPYAEYRSLRWRIATLEAGRAVTVVARVKVPAATEPQAARP
jgi:uncharacterized repeat protein (TIGR01451 family)